MTTTLICDCNQTMPLNAKALGEALHEDLTLHSTLCRRDAGAFQKPSSPAGRGGGLHPGAAPVWRPGPADRRGGVAHPVCEHPRNRGWSRDAAKASPKIAALLAAARLPDLPPVPTVTYKSTGRLLIIGQLDQAEQAAALVSDVLDVTLFTQGPGTRAAPRRGARCWVVASRASWAGWARSSCVVGRQPIDLDLYAAAMPAWRLVPENAIGLTTRSTWPRQSHRACVKVCRWRRHRLHP